MSRRQSIFLGLVLAVAVCGGGILAPAASQALAASAFAMGGHWLQWLYPFYLAAMALLAWYCRGSRPTLAWVLAALLCLADVGLLLLKLT